MTHRATGRSVVLFLLWAVLSWGCEHDPDEEPADPDAGADAAPGLDDAGTDAAAADAGPDAEVPLPTAANLARLTSVLQTLTAPEMNGRLTGSAEGAVAEEFVTATMQATGLETVVQDVPMAVFAPAPPADLSIVDDDGTPITTFEYQDDYREVGFSGSASATGPLHYVGYGTAASYRDIDVTGEIVVMLTTLPGDPGLARLDQKIDRAYQQGAVGVLFVPAGSTLSYDEQLGDILQLNAWANQAGAVDPDLLHDDLPVAFVHVNATRDLLGRTAEDLEEDPTPFSTTNRVHLEIHGTSHLDSSCPNVLGILRGTDAQLGGEAILVSAHYDHVGIGADGRVFVGASDNAAGAAVVLEAAATYAELGRPPARTVVFALFCGEEQGILGSFHYVDHPVIPLEQTALVMNVDYLGAYPLLVLGYDDEPLQNEFLGDALGDVVDPLDLPFQCASDECPFHLEGIPFLHLIAPGWHGHLATDTYENLDLSLVQTTADLTIEGIGLVAYE